MKSTTGKLTTARIASLNRNGHWLSASMMLIASLSVADHRGASAGERPGWDAADGQCLTKDEIQDFGRRPNDIVSRSDLPKLFALLERRGVPVDPNVRTTVASRVLPDSDAMVRNLRTPRGTNFMRQIARYPNAFDRLDRLVRMPYGAARMRELIRGPDGYKLIEYMTTSRGGRNLGVMLSRTRSGGNFNSRTGRLYTVRDAIMFVMQQQRKPRAGG